MHGPLFNLKLQIEFMNKGIVPLGVGELSADTWQDINRILAAMPPEEARRMKRKFRKEWRRIVKRRLDHGGRKGRREANEVGLGFPTPRRSHKNCRKQKVSFEVRKSLSKALVGSGGL